MAAIGFAAAQLAIQNHAVGAVGVVLEPAQQRGAKVEADARVVIDDADDLVLRVHNARCAVWRIALGADALVPVVIRRGRVLRLHGLEPRVLAGRLVEVTVNADVAFG